MDDPHLEVLRRWMTPAELEQIRKAQGDPDEIVARTQQIDRIIERATQREAIWQFLKMVGLAFVTVVGLVATAKGLLPADWWP
jgi:hypothetical protein